MKVLLTTPPYTLEDRYGKNLKHFGGDAEPLGLAYIAAAARKDGHDVEILDAPVQNFTPEMIAQKAKDDKFDLVGITGLTPAFGRVKATMEALKIISPDTITVIGGPHSSILPEETMKQLDADFIVIGEGENTIRELLTTIESKGDFHNVKGICFKENGIIIKTPSRPFEKDIDNLPLPARDLLPMEKYFLTATRTNRSGFCGTVIVSRGCPFNCSFCSHTFGRTFRHHSPARIISEIEELITQYKATQINLEADTLTIDKKFLSALCDSLIENNIHKKVKWTCESRADTIDEDILKKMKAAGCWQISLGVESGVDRLLNVLNKGETTEQILRASQLIKKSGISIRGFFMLGIPTETKEDSLETIEFAKKIDPDWAQFTLTIPYPGTPMYDKLKQNGEIKSFNWDDYRTWAGWKESDLPYIPEGRTKEELRHLQKYAMRSFYLRPKIFLRFLKKINSWNFFVKSLLGLLMLLKIKRSNN